ncbi:MAG: GAF domain-containing protein [Polyangiaceae bacterium]|nr:GAF domain-containing protein [Polyangiaceae bacterium]
MTDDKPPLKTGGPDSQPPDLNREREELLRSFPRGGRFGEELAPELERLRQRMEELERENASLRARLEEEDAIRRLLERVEALEAERGELLSRTHHAEQESSVYHDRFRQVEMEFANMANLFVASNQLHSSMSPRRVTRRIKEILAQLVGAERYCMYLTTADGRELVPVASEGIGTADQMPIRVDDPRFAAAVRSCASAFDEKCDPSQGSIEHPAVVFPLTIDDRVVGAIAIFSTLSQKTSLSTIDFELFRLLGQHAAAALVSASLFVHAEQKIPGLEAFLDLSV